MRKLSFLLAFAVLSLVSTTTFAQEMKEEVKEVVQDKVEVQISELPTAVTKALGKQFVEYSAEKAFKSTKDGKVVYYVKLVKDGAHEIVLIDAEGIVLEQSDKEEKSK